MRVNKHGSRALKSARRRKHAANSSRKLVLTEAERKELTRLSRKRTATYDSVIRAKIVLMANRGLSHREIGRGLGLGRRNVRNWIKRFEAKRAEGLLSSFKKIAEPDQRIARLSVILGNLLREKVPNATLAAIGVKYRELYGEALSKSTLSRLICRSDELKRVQQELHAIVAKSPEKAGFILANEERGNLVRVSRNWLLPHHEVMRARVMLLADNGISNQEIGRRLNLDRKVISRWKRRYLKHRSVKAPPRFRVQSEESKAARETCRKRILAILHDRPAAYGINRASWNLGALSEAYETQFGEKVSRSAIHRLIKKSGYSFKKARRVLTSPDPDYRAKVELLLNTLRSLGKDEHLFFIDEMGPVRVKKYGGRSHVPARQTVTFPQVQAHKGAITMSAALNATQNQVTWIYALAKDSHSMIDLIEMLFNQYHTARTLYLTWDAASWHRSAELLQWLDTFNAETTAIRTGPIINLLPLPRCAQFLDVLEAVFSGLKRAVIHHSDYPGKVEMKTAISKHFQDRNAYFELNPKRAGKKIWEIDFFSDVTNIKSGTYREW